MLHATDTERTGTIPPAAAPTPTSVQWMIRTGRMDHDALKAHFLRQLTTIQLTCGLPADDPHLRLYASKVRGSEPYVPCTLMIATSQTARMVVVADRDGRPYRDGMFLEDRATGQRMNVAARTATTVICFLAQQHLVLGILAEQTAALAREARGPLPARRGVETVR
jgi:hypothetical protein